MDSGQNLREHLRNAFRLRASQTEPTNQSKQLLPRAVWTDSGDANAALDARRLQLSYSYWRFLAATVGLDESHIQKSAAFKNSSVLDLAGL